MISNRSAHEPLVRVAKCKGRPTSAIILLRIGALLLALVAGGLFLFALGYNPIDIYSTIVNGAFRSKMAIQGTVKIAIPLLIASLGVTVAFKMRFWNIGAEGQFTMGAVFASYFALYHADIGHTPLLIIMAVAGMIGGALWGLIPAYFKTRFGANETLLTLMLNYIAIHFVSYLQTDPWRDPSAQGFTKIARFAKNAQLDKVWGIQAGWIVGLALTALVFVYLRYTKQGYEVTVVGESPETARYAGIHVNRVIIRTMLLSGAICGLGGMLQACGSDMTLSPTVANNVGFTGIVVAWLSHLNAFVIVIVTALLSILTKGASVVQSTYGLSTDCASVLQGILLFFVLGAEFFVRYRFVWRKRGGNR